MSRNRRTLDWFTEYMSEEETNVYKWRLYDKSIDLLNTLDIEIGDWVDRRLKINNSIDRRNNIHQTSLEIKKILSFNSLAKS